MEFSNTQVEVRILFNEGKIVKEEVASAKAIPPFLEHYVRFFAHLTKSSTQIMNSKRHESII